MTHKVRWMLNLTPNLLRFDNLEKRLKDSKLDIGSVRQGILNCFDGALTRVDDLYSKDMMFRQNFVLVDGNENDLVGLNQVKSIEDRLKEYFSLTGLNAQLNFRSSYLQGAPKHLLPDMFEEEFEELLTESINYGLDHRMSNFSKARTQRAWRIGALFSVTRRYDLVLPTYDDQQNYEIIARPGLLWNTLDLVPVPDWFSEFYGHSEEHGLRVAAITAKNNGLSLTDKPNICFRKGNYMLDVQVGDKMIRVRYLPNRHPMNLISVYDGKTKNNPDKENS